MPASGMAGREEGIRRAASDCRRRGKLPRPCHF
jgi:hypothetical protein